MPETAVSPAGCHERGHRISAPHSPTISVIIVNWNTGALLAACLRSVRDGARRIDGGVEVIVVDNASSDGSLTVLARECPGARAIANDANHGFARANNQGIAVAVGRYLLLLNPDTVVGEDALAQMVAFMDANPRAGGAGPLLVTEDGETQESSTPLPTLGREFLRLFHLTSLSRSAAYPLDEWRKGGPRRVETLQGACVVLRREAMQRVGVLDERFFIYTEEVDLCRRMRDAGWELFWLPQASVLHYGGQSTRQVAGAMFIQLYRSKVLYFRKHQGRAAAWTYKALLAAAAVPRILLPALWLVVRPGAASTLRPLMRNYATLLRELPGL